MTPPNHNTSHSLWSLYVLPHPKIRLVEQYLLWAMSGTQRKKGSVRTCLLYTIRYTTSKGENLLHKVHTIKTQSLAQRSPQIVRLPPYILRRLHHLDHNTQQMEARMASMTMMYSRDRKEKGLLRDNRSLRRPRRGKESLMGMHLPTTSPLQGRRLRLLMSKYRLCQMWVSCMTKK